MLHKYELNLSEVPVKLAVTLVTYQNYDLLRLCQKRYRGRAKCGLGREGVICEYREEKGIDTTGYDSSRQVMDSGEQTASHSVS